MLTLFWLGIKIGIMICSRREYYGISENREKYRTMPYVRRRDEEYGFAIEDFFTDQEKSREFLEQLVERAEEEVGYEVESGMVSMQLMKMPDESLVITFSDRSEEGIQGMMEQLHNLTEMIGEDGELTPEDMENLV